MDETTLQYIKDLIILLIPLLLAPGWIAFFRLREEKKKLSSEAKKQDVDAASELASKAMVMIQHHEEDTQRYRDMSKAYEQNINDLKKEFSGCKEQLVAFSGELTKVLDENAKLTKINIELSDRIRNLESVVKSLSDQIKELGYEPLFGKRSNDSNIMRGDQ